MKDAPTDRSTEPQGDAQAALPPPDLAAFEAAIERQEDILYGIALFFEVLSVVYKSQNAFVETTRKQFRNIIQLGSNAIQQARELLQAAQLDAARRAEIRDFHFLPGEGHPDPASLVQRAEALIVAYETAFPERPRDEELSEADTLRLVQAASDVFAQAKTAT